MRNCLANLRKESHERTVHSSANSLWVWNTKIPRSDLPILQYSKPCLLGGNGVPVFKVWSSELNLIVSSLEVWFYVTIPCHTYVVCRKDFIGWVTKNQPTFITKLFLLMEHQEHIFEQLMVIKNLSIWTTPSKPGSQVTRLFHIMPRETHSLKGLTTTQRINL